MKNRKNNRNNAIHSNRGTILWAYHFSIKIPLDIYRWLLSNWDKKYILNLFFDECKFFKLTVNDERCFDIPRFNQIFNNYNSEPL